MKNILRQHLEQTFSDLELKRWYDPLELRVAENEKTLSVCFPHAFFSSWFADNVQGKFEEQMSRYFGPGLDISYENGSGGRPQKASGAPAPVTRKVDFPFGNQFTFDSFLVNKKNYFPLASAKEVATQKSVVFNPFIICGENGSGKTHLLRAIGNDLSRGTDTSKIYLGSIEDVSNIYSTRFKNDPFRAREFFYSFDVLLIDDFQQIRQYASLQQELIILFNRFHDSRKQMIFACSDKVTSYDFLDPTLKSRLEWGLIVNLKRPDFEIRVKFIQRHLRQKSIRLTKEQELTLAQRFQDFRFLQGILLKIFAYRQLVNKDIGPQDFEHILSHTEDRPTPQLTPDRIISVAAEHFGVDVRDIKGSRRLAKIVQARQVAMFLCRELLGASYPQLGRIFGGKDHSTVLYAVNKVKQNQNVSKDTKKLLETLKETCLSCAQDALPPF